MQAFGWVGKRLSAFWVKTAKSTDDRSPLLVQKGNVKGFGSTGEMEGEDSSNPTIVSPRGSLNGPGPTAKDSAAAMNTSKKPTGAVLFDAEDQGDTKEILSEDKREHGGPSPTTGDSIKAAVPKRKLKFFDPKTDYCVKKIDQAITKNCRQVLKMKVDVCIEGRQVRFLCATAAERERIRQIMFGADEIWDDGYSELGVIRYAYAEGQQQDVHYCGFHLETINPELPFCCKITGAYDRFCDLLRDEITLARIISKRKKGIIPPQKINPDGFAFIIKPSLIDIKKSEGITATCSKILGFELAVECGRYEPKIRFYYATPELEDRGFFADIFSTNPKKNQNEPHIILDKFMRNILEGLPHSEDEIVVHIDEGFSKDIPDKENWYQVVIKSDKERAAELAFEKFCDLLKDERRLRNCISPKQLPEEGQPAVDQQTDKWSFSFKLC